MIEAEHKFIERAQVASRARASESRGVVLVGNGLMIAAAVLGALQLC